MFNYHVSCNDYKKALDYVVDVNNNFLSRVLADVPVCILKNNSNVLDVIVQYLYFKMNKTETEEKISNVPFDHEYSEKVNELYAGVTDLTDLKHLYRLTKEAYTKFTERKILAHVSSNEFKLISVLRKAGELVNEMIDRAEFKSLRQSDAEFVKAKTHLERTFRELYFPVDFRFKERRTSLSDEIFERYVGTLFCPTVSAEEKKNVCEVLYRDKTETDRYVQNFLDEYNKLHSTLRILCLKFKTLCLKADQQSEEIARLRIQNAKYSV